MLLLRQAPGALCTQTYVGLNELTKQTRKSVDGEPSHIPALIKANRIEASYFLAYVAKYG